MTEVESIPCSETSALFWKLFSSDFIKVTSCCSLMMFAACMGSVGMFLDSLVLKIWAFQFFLKLLKYLIKFRRSSRLIEDQCLLIFIRHDWIPAGSIRTRPYGSNKIPCCLLYSNWGLSSGFKVLAHLSSSGYDDWMDSVYSSQRRKSGECNNFRWCF